VGADTQVDPRSFEAPPLSEVQQRIVAGLRADGIATARFSELFDDAFWAELEADIAPFVAENTAALEHLGNQPAHKDDVIVRRFHVRGKEEPEAFTLDSPWLRLALSEEIIDVVSAYRGHPVSLFYLDNWFTPPFAGADDRVASQRWHRDPEEDHVVKVFVYLSDVDEDSGPFEYVQGSPTGNRYGAFRPWEGKGSGHPDDDEIKAATAPEDRLTLTGRRGTIIFCDTSGFHRGGFARTKPRVMYASTYVAPLEEKGKRRFRVDLAGRTLELSAQALAALD
jgi:hypothetical protein